MSIGCTQKNMPMQARFRVRPAAVPYFVERVTAARIRMMGKAVQVTAVPVAVRQAAARAAAEDAHEYGVSVK